MKPYLVLTFAALSALVGCSKDSSSSVSAGPGSFSNNVNAIASTTPDNTEPGEIDGFPADAPDNTEPATL